MIPMLSGYSKHFLSAAGKAGASSRMGSVEKEMRINAMCCDEAPFSQSHVHRMAAERRAKRFEPIWTEQSTYNSTAKYVLAHAKGCTEDVRATR